MADVQSIDKPNWIMTCKDLPAHFIALYKENMNLMNFMLCLTCHSKIVSEYDQEIPQSQTADNPVAPRGRAAQPSRDTRKTN